MFGLIGKSIKAKPILLVIRFASSASNQHLLKEKWDLYAGVLVERLPIVTKKLTPLENEFQQYLWQVEYEKSLKSDHEMQHEREAIQAELTKAGKVEVDLDEVSSKQTAQDLEDACSEELKKFEPASRLTADDKSNNLKSTNRKLDDILYLLTEQYIGDQKHLLLPQGIRADGETMRQTAERVLRERCGDSLKVQFYGNAPCGFYKFKYPKHIRKNSLSVGAKLFFYRAILKLGNVDNKVCKNFKWLEKSHLVELFPNAAYNESVQKFLL